MTNEQTMNDAMTNGVELPQGYSRHDRAVRFFYKHAGWSYDQKVETSEQGRLRCAREMAKAEEHAFDHDWSYVWGPDECIGGDCGETDSCDHACCQGSPHEVEFCILEGSEGQTLESLSSICEPSREYRRVVEAELALEAMSGVAGLEAQQ